MKKIKLLVYCLLVSVIVLSSFRSTFFYKVVSETKHSDTTKPNTYGYYFNCKRGPVEYNVYDGMHNLIIDTADTYCDFIFFYADSGIFIFSTVLKHFDSIQSVINEKYFQSRSKNQFKNLGKRGNYRVKGSNVYATVYWKDPSRFHSKIKEELKMSIKNSDTLFLLQSVCNQCKNQYADYNDQNTIIFAPPKNFDFVRLSNKPDSSMIFSKKLSFYLKGVH